MVYRMFNLQEHKILLYTFHMAFCKYYNYIVYNRLVPQANPNNR